MRVRKKRKRKKNEYDNDDCAVDTANVIMG